MAVCVEAAGWERGWEFEAGGIGCFFSAVAGMAVAFAEEGCPEEEAAVDLGRTSGRENWPAGRCGTAGAVLVGRGLGAVEDEG